MDATKSLFAEMLTKLKEFDAWLSFRPDLFSESGRSLLQGLITRAEAGSQAPTQGAGVELTETELESLENAFFEGYNKSACNLTVNRREGIQAVIAKFLTLRTVPAGTVGALSEERIESLYDIAVGSFPFQSFRNIIPEFRGVLIAFARSIATPAPVTPFHRTAEKAPTKADAWPVVGHDADDCVLACSDGRGWAFAQWESVKNMPQGWHHWMPLPPIPLMPAPPVSPEEAAFEEALIAAGFGSSTYDAKGKEDLRRLFIAGMNLTQKEDK